MNAYVKEASHAFIDTLRGSLRGPLIAPGDDGYDAARAVYNGMIQRHPGAIAKVADVADVITCVNVARAAGVTVAVRGGGLGVGDGGLVVDLRRLRGIRVDPKARTIQIKGGATWGDADHAAHPFGLATPSGFISTTGVGGLTLGGGSGYLTRSCGLTISNPLSADVVLADGRMVTASDDENADLFWALRGGGGNFGIVTSFLFRAHPVDNIIGGPTFWALEHGEDALRGFQTLIEAAPEALGGFFAVLTVPPRPTLPRGAPRTQSGRRGVLLQRLAGVLRRHRRPLGRGCAPFASRPSRAPVSRAAVVLRPPLSQRPAMVLAGRLHAQALR